MPESEDYRDAIPVRADGDIEEGARHAETPPPEKPPARFTALRFGFFQKVTIHIVLMIGAGVISIAVLTAWHFRRQAYEQEAGAAEVLFAAITDDVADHYQKELKQLDTTALNTGLPRRYVPAVGPARHVFVLRPCQVQVFDAQGAQIFAYADGSRRPTQTTPPHPVADHVRMAYEEHRRFLRISGPAAPGIPITVHVVLPTDAPARVRELYRDMSLLAGATIALAVILSLFFTRREMSPVRSLTRAAHEIRGGDLNQLLPVIHHDEIGELTSTFNDMSASLARRIDLMNHLQDWVVRIGRVLDSRRLHATLVETFAGMAGTKACRLYTCRSGAAVLDVRAEAGGEGLPAPSTDVLAATAFQERWSQYLREDGTVSAEAAEACEAALPLLSGQERIGVVRIGRRSGDARYDAETLTVLQTLALHASVALQNANLYSELARRERMQQEMLWAREIQRSMLPRRAPDLPGYEACGISLPASEVGGDYFDYLCARQKDWHFVIGDASGKGVPAAILMSLVRALIHTYLEFESSPREVLTRVNRSLSRDLDPDMFVTMSTLRLDPVRHTVHIARAGHEPILLARESGDVITVAPSGVALGLMDVPTFEQALEETELSLKRHDTLLLYTDGVTEARDAADQEFGAERLRRLLQQHARLPAQRLLDQLVSAVREFTAGIPQLDDITLLVLKRNGDEGSLPGMP